MYIKNKKGQSTVEYVLLVTAVLAAIIAFTTSSGQNSFKTQLNNTLSTVVGDIGTEGSQLDSSHNPSPANATVPAAPYSVVVSNLSQ